MTTEKETLLIRLQPKTKAELRKAALAEDRSMAYLAERIIGEWLRRPTKGAKKKPRA